MTTAQMDIQSPARLIEWFTHAHPELIGEGGVIDNAIRLLDWAYVGVCERPELLPAKAIEKRGARGRDRMADALADLADALVSIRERVDKSFDQDAEDRRQEEARNGKREPAEWQDALAHLRESMRAIVYGARTAGGQVPVGTEPYDDQKLADAIVAEIDRRLRDRGSWSLMDAFRTLGGKPPKDLRAEAEAFADSHGAQGPSRLAAIEAYLAGAGVER